MASAGRAWTEDVEKAESVFDPYAPPQKRSLISGTGAAVLGGAGLTALGARNIRDSKSLPETATARAHNAGIKHAEVLGRQQRALTHAARQEAVQQNTRKGARWMRTGKVRRARRELELVSQEADRSKAAMALRHAERSPAQLANRSMHLSRGGKAMVAGGIATATAPIWSRPFRKSDDVSKTISQARYGSNAEMGRAWRGPEKKDRKEATVAAGAGAVGVAGGTAAVAAHRLRPAKMADRSPELRGALSRAASADIQAGVTRDRLSRDLMRSKLYSGTTDWGGLARLRREHGIATAEMPIARRKQPGKMMGGGLIGHLEEKHKAAVKTAAERRAETTTAHQAAVGHAGELKANAAKRVKFTRTKRAGVGLAAVGGATALAAGIKAERGRKPRPESVRKPA